MKNNIMLKRIISVLLLMFFALLVGCQYVKNDNNAQNSGSRKQAEIDETKVPDYIKDKSVIPQDIIVLQDPEELDEGKRLPYEANYRAIYYEIDAIIFNLANGEEAYKWYEEFVNDEYLKTEPQEMFLVSFIKKFNISREAFDGAVNRVIQANIKLGLDMTLEQY